MRPAANAVAIAPARGRASDYVALAKPRLNVLVIASALAGYAMGGGESARVGLLLSVLVGTGLVASGASAFNQMYERDADALMMAFASVFSLAGLVILAFGANPLSAGVALATLLSYTVVYTPLKKHSSFATVIGAIPGALPPVIGWTAARTDISLGAWVLFGIVFLWQLPHFLAIAWIYREDYARAGFPMLPVIEPDGRSTGRQAVVYAAALLPVSLAPRLIGMAGNAYFIGAMLLTLLFVGLSLRFASTRSIPDARRLFFGSILYLPLLWILMIADRV